MNTVSQNLHPPVAKVVPKSDTVLGDTRVDPYFWLRDRKNPEVIAYLEAENKYTQEVMKHTEPLREKLYGEMVARIKETDLSVPERIGEWFYYTRTQQGKQYPIFCRRKGSLEAPEEVILDQNPMAAGLQYFRTGAIKVSPDHELLAYSTDTTGAEVYTLVVKNLKTGELYPERILNTYDYVEWANDNRTLFYTTLDEAKRPYRLYRHVLGTEPSADVLVYEEKDPIFDLTFHKTRSRAYLLLDLRSFNSTETRYLSADHPADPFRVLQARRPDLEYHVDHSGDRFFILTNEGATNFKIMKAPVSDPSEKNWKSFLAHRDTVLVDEMDAFRDYLAVYEREKAQQRIRMIDLRTGVSHYVDFPEPVYTFHASRNPDFDSHLLRFTYTSLVTPPTVFDYNMEHRTRELKKATEVLGGYDPSRYQTERTWARASDGTLVPVSMVYRKPLVRDGKRPLLLYAYGSYGLSTDPNFSSTTLTLLDRGFIYAIAHIRGGQEMGRTWYDQGKLLNKKNTFSDFIACAEHLIGEKYTSADRLAIRGGSAGGMLMGAVVNMRPDLFKAVVADVPFVDVLNTELDASIPLTTQEWVQWGDPNKEPYYSYIKSYAPYENVKAQAYPDMLITAGLNDPRVPYWEPAKWTAKLRAMKTDHNTLLLKTNMGAGHGGMSGRYDAIKEVAFRYAFVLDALGMAEADGADGAAARGDGNGNSTPKP